MINTFHFHFQPGFPPWILLTATTLWPLWKFLLNSRNCLLTSSHEKLFLPPQLLGEHKAVGAGDVAFPFGSWRLLIRKPVLHNLLEQRKI